MRRNYQSVSLSLSLSLCLLSPPPPIRLVYCCLAQLGHEGSHDIVVEFFPLRPTLLLGVGIERPDPALVDTQAQQLMSSVIDGKLKLVKDNAVCLSLNGLDQLGVPLCSQTFTQSLDVPEHLTEEMVIIMMVDGVDCVCHKESEKVSNECMFACLCVCASATKTTTIPTTTTTTTTRSLTWTWWST